MSVSCAYCLIKININNDIYMADDKAFCSNRHRDMWNMSSNKGSLAHLKINTKIISIIMKILETILV